MAMYPQARREGVLLQEIDGEIIAYNTANEQIYLLNPTTALVFEHLDGATNPEALTSVMVERLGLPADTGLVALALQELRQAGLLEEAAAQPQQTVVTRREVMKRLSLTGAMLALMPVVQSVVVPTPAMAQSVGGQTCVEQGGTCDHNTVCCPLLQCTNTMEGPKCSPPGMPDRV